MRRAEKLYALIQEKDQLGTQDAERLQAIERDLYRYTHGDLDAGILAVRGEAGQRIQEARADAQDEVSRALAKVNTFRLERVAFEASPELYKMRKVLAALSQELDSVRKYVVIVDPENTTVIIESDERDISGLEIIESSSN